MKLQVNDFVKVKNMKTPVLVRNIFKDDKGTVINYVPEYRHNGLGPNNKNIKLEDIEYTVRWVKYEQWENEEISRVCAREK